jgi:sarcosine oxidase subunit gamma
MSTDPAGRISPLDHFRKTNGVAAPGRSAGVVISERPFLGHLNLRGDPSDGAFVSGVERALGLALPVEPNTVSYGDGKQALWLGPDEWLIVTPKDEQSAVAVALVEALSGVFSSVTDITGGQTLITLSGKRARDVLAKGCSLDLHPRAFGEGQCAQTLVAGVGVTLLWASPEPSFDLIVRRSFAEYLALWLHDAALEYGIVVE